MAYGSRGRTEHVLVWLTILGVIVGVVAFSAYNFWPHAVSSKQLTIGAKTFYADVADTEQRREHGLKGVTSLPDDHALLMKYPEDDVWTVSTAELEFPIDILWLTSEKRVAYIAKDAQPTGKTLYRPSGKSRYVIQLPAGSIARYSITPGKVVEFKE